MLRNNNFDNTHDTIKMLENEAKILRDIAVREWRKYLDSYTPTQYIRTGKTSSPNAIRVGKVKPAMNGEFLTIEVTWDNDLAYHDSWLYQQGRTNKNQKGHAFMLISDGWKANKLESIYGNSVYRHTEWDGDGYLYRVYKTYWARKNPLIIDVEVQWSGRVVK